MSDAPVAAVAAPVTTHVTPQPVLEPTPQNVVGNLKSDDPILVRDKTGQVQTTKLGDLADAWRNRVDAADMEDLTLMRKAIKDGDAVAAQTLVTKYSGGVTTPPPAPAPTPANADMTALQKEMTELRAQLALIAPTTQTVQEAMELQQIGQSIDIVKDKMPYLIKHPERAQLVRTRLHHYAQLAQSQNLNLAALPLDVRQKVHMKAMEDVEASLKQTVGYYGVPSPNGQQRPNVNSVNDQTRDAAPGVKPARYQIINGQMVDTSQQQPAPSVSAANPAAPLPTAPVTPVPTGGMVGVNGAEVKPSRMTGQQLMDSMRQRSVVLNQTI